MNPLARRLLAEFVGTFALVFVGTGAIIANDLGGGLGNVGISLTFGLVVLAMIYAVGPTSGAHFNPAVSLGFWLVRRSSARDLISYATIQVLAGGVASATLRSLFPMHPTLGATLPSGSVAQSFAIEAIATSFLVFVILSVTTRAKDNAIAGLAIGATVAVGALFAGPISGGSMNPARSVGPALLSQQHAHLWIYLVAPAVGSGLAAVGHRLVSGGRGSLESGGT